MHIPGLGEVHQDSDFGWYRSQPIALSLLNGQECEVFVAGYDEDVRPEDFHKAITNLLANGFEALRKVESHVFRYCQDMNSYWSPDDEEFVAVSSPDCVWEHIQFRRQPMVSRRAYGDKGVYVSLECNCDWEPEHGLQIVLEDGRDVVKVGPYDGHLTNHDAYADDNLEGVIYVAL